MSTVGSSKELTNVKNQSIGISALRFFKPNASRLKTVEDLIVVQQNYRAVLKKLEDKYMETPITTSNVGTSEKINELDDWAKRIAFLGFKIVELNFLEDLSSNITELETVRSRLLRESQVDLETFKKWFEANKKVWKEMELNKKAIEPKTKLPNVTAVPAGNQNLASSASIYLCNNCKIKDASNKASGSGAQQNFSLKRKSQTQ